MTTVHAGPAPVNAPENTQRRRAPDLPAAAPIASLACPPPPRTAFVSFWRFAPQKKIAMQNAATHLVHAVRTRDHARLRELIADPSRLSARTKAGRTALHAAAEEGDLAAIRLLLDAGAEINARTRFGETPLHFAAAHGGICDLMDPDKDRGDPFRRNRRVKLQPDTVLALTEILKTKSDALPADLGPLDTLSPSQKRDAILAALDCFAEPARLVHDLKERGIDLDLTDPDFAEELRGNPRFLGVVEHLLAHGADIAARDKRGATPLHGAVERGLPEMVELLLRRGAEPNPCDSPDEPNDRGLIDLALDYGKTPVADILLRHGARFDPNTEGKLHDAAANRRSETVRWLLARGADIDGLDSRGDTALISAAGHPDVVSFLLSQGANPRLKNARGSTVLHASACWPPCLELLLPLGLPLDEPDSEGDAPIHLAAQGGSADAVRILTQAGANLNARNSAGASALHRIFDSDEFRPDVEFPVFLALVAAGTDRSIQNGEGLTAFDLASKWNYPPEYLRLLDPDPERVKPAADFIWLGAPAYRVLLPDTPAPIKVDGADWPSSAHYFQAQKTADPALREKVRSSPSLNDAVDHLRGSGKEPPRSWNARCDAVMRHALLAKIQSNPEARETLFATGAATLVADGNCDSYWFENHHAPFNAIGHMLMSIREELRPTDPASSPS